MEVFAGLSSHYVYLFSILHIRSCLYTQTDTGGADASIMSEPMSESGYVNCSVRCFFRFSTFPNIETSTFQPTNQPTNHSFIPPQKSGVASVEELKLSLVIAFPGKMDVHIRRQRSCGWWIFFTFGDVHIFWISWILNVKPGNTFNRAPTPCAREDYLKKEDYGKVPKYLQSIKQANSP